MRLSIRAKSWAGVLAETWREFAKDNGSLVAGAVSFFAFLSIFPMLLAAIGILGTVLGSPERAERMILSATSGYAVGAQVKVLLAQVVRGGNAATGIGLLLLVWSGTTAVVMLENAVNVAWNVRERRGFFARRGLALLLFALTGVLMLISMAATALVRYIERTGPPVLPSWRWLDSPASHLIPLLVVFGLFTLVYKILPNTRVQWRSAVTGGLFAAVLWQIAVHVFAYYVENFAHHNHIYGSLGAVILLLVWINYSATIALLGAELSSIIQTRDHSRQDDASPPQPSSPGKSEAAV